VKGIILAGGYGTRLYPVTKGISKHLIPIYDKPMIYYPLSVLMLAGIRDILIISTADHTELYRKILDDGSQLGMNLRYKIQESPRGLADAFIVGEEFIDGDKVALILGDNVFYGQGLTRLLRNAASLEEGAMIFGYYVNNPEQFGIVEFNKNGEILSLEEKPKVPKSNYAIPGLYFYDEKVVDYAKNLEPSTRGEIEITDLNKVYLSKGKLKLQIFGRGYAWLDTGTYVGLLEASNFVEIIQKRQGLYIACIEEIAYNLGYISAEKLENIAESMNNTEYGRYLKSLTRTRYWGGHPPDD
jgi:glucose-1-phosphate thymidylyltransferase